MSRTFIAATTIAFLVLPAALIAQSDELKAQIRADLQNDPRATEMSSVEFDALVEALALQAHEEGTENAYLESQNSFDYASLFTIETANSTSFSPILIALLSLFSILTVVALYIVMHRGRRLDEPSDVAA